MTLKNGSYIQNVTIFIDNLINQNQTENQNTFNVICFIWKMYFSDGCEKQ